MTDTYKWNHFQINYYYPSTVEKVFQAWSTCEGLKSFFIEEIEVTGINGDVRTDDEQIQTGDKYSWTWRHDYSISGEFKSVIRNERVEFTFGEMMVSVHFKPVSDAVLVQLNQTNIPLTDQAKPTSHMNC